MTLANKNIISLQALPEHKMLFSLAWPVVMSLLIQGLYNFVDSVFIARLGAEALSAVSIAFVVQSLATSFFTGIATGMNAVISRAIGADDKEKGKNAMKSGIAVQCILSIVFILFGMIGVGFYFETTTDNSTVIVYGIQYLQPLMLLCPAMAMQITSERLLQATGLTHYMVYSQIVGTVVNVILDPIFIFGWFGCPVLGVSGAAYATVLGQLSAALTALYFNFKKNSLLFFKSKDKSHFDWGTACLVLKIGLPTAATGIASSFGNYFINRILISFSASANAAFGVYAKLQSIALMPSEGMSAGLVTMYSFFYGKRDFSRMKKTLKAGEIMVEVWNLFCFIIFTAFPVLLMQPFSPSEEMINVGIYCFRIIGITYLTSGLMTGLVAFFQATGHSIYSFLISLSRMVFVRVPVAYFLETFKNVNLIWWCWPISEIVSDTVCLILFVYCYNKTKLQLTTTEVKSS